VRILLIHSNHHSGGAQIAGSVRFRAVPGTLVRLKIAGNPLCRGDQASVPVCDC
jgi:hypothetical protein